MLLSVTARIGVLCHITVDKVLPHGFHVGAHNAFVHSLGVKPLLIENRSTALDKPAFRIVAVTLAILAEVIVELLGVTVPVFNELRKDRQGIDCSHELLKL